MLVLYGMYNSIQFSSVYIFCIYIFQFIFVYIQFIFVAYPLRRNNREIVGYCGGCGFLAGSFVLKILKVYFFSVGYVMLLIKVVARFTCDFDMFLPTQV